MQFRLLAISIISLIFIIIACDNQSTQPAQKPDMLIPEYGDTPLPKAAGEFAVESGAAGTNGTQKPDKSTYQFLKNYLDKQKKYSYLAIAGVWKPKPAKYKYKRVSLHFPDSVLAEADGKTIYYSYFRRKQGARVDRKIGAIIPASKTAAALMDNWLKTGTQKLPITTTAAPSERPGPVLTNVECEEETTYVEGNCWWYYSETGWILGPCGEVTVCEETPGAGGGNPWPDDGGGDWGDPGPGGDPGGGGPGGGSTGGGDGDAPCGDPIHGCANEDPPDFNQPCPGNAIRDPEIAPSGGWNEWGGQYGNTRSSGNQFHDGTDIKASLNSDVYSMYSGTVTDIRDSFSPSEYKSHSYGNYVRIKSTINGETVYLRYNHLNTVDVEDGDIVGYGEIIGQSGNTGNAQTRGHIKVIPHVHIRARKVVNGQEVRVDPEDYMSTKFNNDGSISEDKCM